MLMAVQLPCLPENVASKKNAEIESQVSRERQEQMSINAPLKESLQSHESSSERKNNANHNARTLMQ